MASDHKACNPHWKGDGSYEEDVDFPGYSFRIPVRALNIIWGNDPRFWQFIDLADEESRLTGFKQGALLVQVNWIEVTEKLPMLHFRTGSVTRYEISYVVNFRVDAFGWHSAPIKFKVKANGEETETSMNLEPYRNKHDCWHEIPGGQFSVLDTDGNVEFGMYETDTAWWKAGMVLAGVKIKAIDSP